MTTRTRAVLALLLIASAAAAAPKERQARRRGFSIGPDGRVAARAGKDKVRLLDAQGNTLSEESLPAPAAETAFSPDGKKLAVCLEKGGLVVLEEGKARRTVAEPSGQCSDLEWSSDGARLHYVLTRVGTESPNAPDDTEELKAWESADGRLKSLSEARIERPDSGFKGNVAPSPQPSKAELGGQKAPPGLKPTRDALGRMPQ